MHRPDASWWLLCCTWVLLILAAGRTFAATVAEEVDRMEDRRYQAMIRGDLAELAEMLGDELLYHQPTGKVADKASVLEEIRRGEPRFHAARRHDVRIQIYGDLVTAMGLTDLDLDVQGERRQVVVRYLNVWVLRDGRWQLVSRQSAFVPN